MKTNSFIIKNEKIIAFVLLSIFFFGIYFFWEYLPTRKLKSQHRYTIGKILYIRYGDNDPSANVVFYVNSKKYDGYIGTRWNKEYKIGKRFFISFYPPDPKIFRVLTGENVNDTINFIPKDGWVERP